MSEESIYSAHRRRLPQTDEIISAILNDPATSQTDKGLLAQAMRRELASAEANLRREGQRINRLNDDIATIEGVRSWANGRPALQRATASSLHHFVAAIQGGDALMFAADGKTYRPSASEISNDAQVFVVQHDWANAFARAEEFTEGDFALPYEKCYFEFKIGGKKVIALACQTDGAVSIAPSIETDALWFCTGWRYRLDGSKLRCDLAGEDPLAPIVRLVASQVRAVAIALEAQIAITGVVRAPHLLNEARAKRGAPPISDYHVVSLSRRTRPTPLDSPERTHRSPRLHFRRGHWRHFEEHKTWIRWTLVGEPSLGFIDKEYRL